MPIDVARYLVVVAPHADLGGPDMARACAFAASGRQSITYRADVWHHLLTPLDRDGVFTILTFRAGDAGDEEFVILPEPLLLDAPPARGQGPSPRRAKSDDKEVGLFQSVIPCLSGIANLSPARSAKRPANA